MEDFVTYEQALKLKELRFDWKCGYYYDKDDQKFKPNVSDLYATLSTDDLLFDNNKLWKCISAPTLSQAQKWLREVKGMHVFSQITNQPELKGKYYWIITDKNGVIIDTISHFKLVDTYEQALSAGIDEVLEIIE